MALTIDEKLHGLRRILSDLGSVLVAYSGGVDSTFLLNVAVGVLGESVLAVTEQSEVEPSQDVRQAREFAASLGVKHLLIDACPLDDPHFANNAPDRCYWCKHRLFSRLTVLAKAHGLAHVIDGTNIDDLQDYRPGMKALTELSVRSPLREAGLTKDNIRVLSQRMHLPTWDKPASPCLASRFPYGTRITVEGLTRVQRAEEYLVELGFRVLRVRDHGDIARIEVSRQDQTRFFNDGVSEKVVTYLKALGYAYVCLDLQGYRMGSMNETLARIRE